MGVEYYAVNLDKREIYDLSKSYWLCHLPPLAGPDWDSTPFIELADMAGAPTDDIAADWLRTLLAGRWRGDRVVVLQDDMHWQEGPSELVEGVDVPDPFLWWPPCEPAHPCGTSIRPKGWRYFSDWQHPDGLGTSIWPKGATPLLTAG